MKLLKPVFFAGVFTALFNPGLALANSPFGVGISEGGGIPSGPFGWILAQQIAFEQTLTRAVHAVVASPSAALTLAGLSFFYGVFHAAGPGHGKAVLASYMIANEQALKRGLVLSFLAALLQGLVAVALVALLALVLHATAQTMQGAAHGVEVVSFAAIAVLGSWLVWKKGGAFLPLLSFSSNAEEHGHEHHGHDHHDHDHHDHDHDHNHAEHVHDEHCGHFHAPAPETLGAGFSWKNALMTVVAAGSRPCSGAILVLVFALSQGIFWAGVAATFAMSVGTALTTGALAATAVLAKGVALRLTGVNGARTELVLRGLEFAAACLVFVVGLGLLLGMVGTGA